MHFLLIKRRILKTTSQTSKISNLNKSLQFTVYILVCKCLLNSVLESKSKIIFSLRKACLGEVSSKVFVALRKHDFACGTKR